MLTIRRLASLLAVVALALSGLVAAPTVHAAPGEPGEEPELFLKRLEMGAAPLYGRNQTLAFATNITAQETVATVYLTPEANSPLTDVLATRTTEGAISWPTSPRFLPGQDYWVRLVVSKETQSVTSTRLRFTVAPIPSTVSFERTTLDAHERLRVRPVAAEDTGVPAGGSITISSGGASLGTAPVVDGAATFRVEPGTRDVIAAYTGGNGWSPSQGGATVSVAKAVVTPTAAQPTLRVAAHEPVALDLTFTSSEPRYAPGGAYTLLARPAGSTDPASDIVIEEHGYAGPLRIDLTSWAAAHVGRWDLHLLTSETDRLAFGTTRVATLQVDPGRTPTAIDLPAPTSSVAYGDPRGRVVGTLTSTGTHPVDGRVRLLEDGRSTGIETAVSALGTVRLPLSSLPVGDHALSLELYGATAYAGSVSATRTFTVRKAATRVSLPGRVAAGGTLTAPVTTTDSPVAAVGAVTLREGSKVVGTGAVRDGVGTVRLPAGLAPGRHVLVADYAGSATHAAGSSAPTTVTVTPARKVASRVTGTVRRVVRRGVTTVTVVARVSASAPVTGRVQVRDGRRVVRILTLRPAARGRVNVVLPRLRPGRHALRLTYLGSPTVLSSGRTWTVTVPRRGGR